MRAVDTPFVVPSIRIRDAYIATLIAIALVGGCERAPSSTVSKFDDPETRLPSADLLSPIDASTVPELLATSSGGESGATDISDQWNIEPAADHSLLLAPTNTTTFSVESFVVSRPEHSLALPGPPPPARSR
jgi:hypothetical protein